MVRPLGDYVKFDRCHYVICLCVLKCLLDKEVRFGSPLMLYKIGMYILSLWLLFVFVFIITIDIPICFDSECKFVGLGNLFVRNIVPTISLILCFLGFLSLWYFKYKLGGTTNIPFGVENVKSLNYEHLTFLATYIIPLISFNFGSLKYLLVLSLLLIVMGAIYIKTDLFYANPSLALIGFQIYQVEGNFKNNISKSDIIVISLDKLKAGDKVSYIKLDERVYYGKRV